MAGHGVMEPDIGLRISEEPAIWMPFKILRTCTESVEMNVAKKSGRPASSQRW
jgi:hypothetical protein